MHFNLGRGGISKEGDAADGEGGWIKDRPFGWGLGAGGGENQDYLGYFTNWEGGGGGVQLLSTYPVA